MTDKPWYVSADGERPQVGRIVALDDKPPSQKRAGKPIPQPSLDALRRENADLKALLASLRERLLSDDTAGLVAEARRLCDAATPDMRPVIYERTPEEHREWFAQALSVGEPSVLYGVEGKPPEVYDPPLQEWETGRAVVCAVTGNGPTSADNAAFFAWCRTNVPKLCAALEAASRVLFDKEETT